MLFDTHVHFESLEGDRGAEALIRRAKEAGVDRMLAIGGSEQANELSVEIARQFPGVVRAAIGYDRDQAIALAETPEGMTDRVSALGADMMDYMSRRIPVVAIGEIGLDFHYSRETAEQQYELFYAQLALARSVMMPVVVHTREADDATLNALGDHADAWIGSRERLGVVHCFSGDKAFAEELLDLGFHISFSGMVTFKKNDDLRSVAATIPAKRLLIETDSPLLSPEPHRGKPNEPARVLHVAETLATIRNTTPEAIAQCTAANAERLFGMPR